MLVKIVHIDFESKSASNGKAYEVAEVIYEANGKKNNKKIMSFSNPGVFKALKSAGKGASFEVEMVKDNAGYWQWTSMSPIGGGSDDAPVTSRVTGPSTQATNRSYETKEERDARQRLIVRQSSLSAAVSILTPGAKAPIDPDAVKNLASDLTDWVFEKVDLFDQPDDLPE